MEDLIKNKKYIVSGKDTNGDEFYNEELTYSYCEDLIDESFLIFLNNDKKIICFHSENIYKIEIINEK